MKPKIKSIIPKIIIIFILSSGILAANDNDEQHLISKTNFTPLIANPYEARMGFMSQPAEDKIRLDIGAAFDIAGISSPFNKAEELYFAVEMMTFTRLRSEGRFKFPVETTDYYFGVNFSQLFSKDKSFIGNKDEFRLRLAHVSSHMIDGLSNDGQFEQMPFTFSKEFVEFLFRTQFFNIGKDIKPYIGINYIFSKIPDSIEELELKSGLEVRHRFENSDFGISSGYDFTLKGVNGVYSGVHSLQAGIEYYFYDNRSVSLNLYGYDGLSMHGMFYFQKDSYIGVGIQVYYF